MGAIGLVVAELLLVVAHQYRRHTHSTTRMTAEAAAVGTMLGGSPRTRPSPDRVVGYCSRRSSVGVARE